MKEIGIQYPQLNPIWLLLGTGEMFIKPASQSVDTAQLEQLLKEYRDDHERLLRIVESQQRTIETLAKANKKEDARQEKDAGCADVV